MDDQRLQQLEEYRAQALEKLASMGEYLTSSEDIDYQTIISLARSTKDANLLGKALDKINAIEDQRERSEALLSFLDEVEYEIAEDPSVVSQSKDQSEVANEETDA